MSEVGTGTHAARDASDVDAARRLRFDPSRAIVLVVDAQNDFCHADGLQARQGKDVARLAPAIAALEAFLPRARAAGVPVVFVRNLHGDGTDAPNWLARHLQERAQSCQAGTWGAEFVGTGPVDGDVVVDKHRYSAFADTELRSRVRELGRDSILFTGFTTNVCVESSLREAVCRDLLATLVEDCCGAYSQAAHDATVASVGAGFGVVATSSDVVAVWERSPHPTSVVASEVLGA